VRAESAGPAVVIVTLCRTAQPPANGRGRVPPPPMETVPDTTARCAPRPAGPPQVSARSTRRALRRELAEVFRVEVLEVGFQRVRVERLRGARPRLAGVDGGVLQ